MTVLRGKGEKRGPPAICPTCHDDRYVLSSGRRQTPCPTCRVDDAAAFHEGREVTVRTSMGDVCTFTPRPKRGTDVVLQSICKHGDPPWECEKCKEFHEQAAKYASASRSATVDLGKTRFRLSQIRVDRVNMDTEPVRSGPLAELAQEKGWQDIVITVSDRAGNVFEVGRVTCQYDGMLGHSTAAAELVVRRSWGSEEEDSVSCPLCYERGHGAGICPRR